MNFVHADSVSSNYMPDLTYFKYLLLSVKNQVLEWSKIKNPPLKFRKRVTHLIIQSPVSDFKTISSCPEYPLQILSILLKFQEELFLQRSNGFPKFPQLHSCPVLPELP
jgi:hypothetical protein